MRKWKIYRWWKGGLWILHRDCGWVQGRWMNICRTTKEYIYDERNHGYHRTLVSIIKLEDYSK